MIRLACTNCREVLSIDDAFAGGVCRCQHCGTIQTVPAKTQANEVAVGGPNLGGGRNGSTVGSLYEGTGLDELAGAVASSGLQSTRLRRPDAGSTAVAGGTATASRAPAARHKSPTPLFIAAGVVIAVLIGIVVYMATRAGPSSAGKGTDGKSTAAGGTAGPSNPAAVAGPNFCGTTLPCGRGATVIYVLDGGNATAAALPAVRDATYRSILSLGTTRQFQIVFWDNGSEQSVAYPSKDPIDATAAQVNAARSELADVYVGGSTDARPAIKAALAHHPDVVVLATAKGPDYLNDQWVTDVMALRGSGSTKFVSFSVTGSGGESAEATPALQSLADRTGGTYVPLATSALEPPSR